jgi:gliding motility-associated-like protein
VKVSSFDFRNTSTSPDNANMTYLWTFSDGVTQTSTDVTRSFTNVGIYDVHLDVTTEFGCKATSASQIVHVLTNGKPNFTFDSICVGRPVTFRNLSNENGSAAVNYLWDFNNGGPQVNIKDPLPVIYNINPGKVDVTLKMTTLGCELDTQRMIRTVQVNRQVAGHKYNSITIPQASTSFMHVRDTVGTFYSWRPRVNLSSYDTRYTEATAVDDITYYIDIADKHTCVTTDTISILVLKKPGFYLPSAFTPNGDGLNDLVRPYLVGMKGLHSFSVFNRWGNQIYYSEKYGDGWDGKHLNVTQAAGVYIWILKFYDANNKLVTEKGTITLIR